MRRFVFVLLAALCSAELSEDELVKYGNELFNDCTQCNIMNAAREQPELLQQITIGISTLPDVYRSQAMLMIQQWTAKLATTPASDCNPICQKSPTASACSALKLLAKDVADRMLSHQEEELKACNGDKACIEEHSSKSELITAGIRVMTDFVAYYADPKESCGLEESAKAPHVVTLKSPKKIFACKVCRATLEFIHSTVVGGESKTSKSFIRAVGNAGVKACNKLKIDKILKFVGKILGKNSLCDEVPALVTVFFKNVVAPLFGEKATNTCNFFFKEC